MEIIGTHEGIKKAISSLMTEFYGLYNAGFANDHSQKNDHEDATDSLQCEVEFCVPYSFSENRYNTNDLNGLFSAKHAKTELEVFKKGIEELSCDGKLARMARFGISGKMLNVLGAQYCIFESMQKGINKFVRLDFKISTKSYEVTKRSGRFQAENIRECKLMKFEQSGENVGVCLEGEFSNVQRTFKNLMMMKLWLRSFGNAMIY